jgi:heterodisulfide reductase subunit D
METNQKTKIEVPLYSDLLDSGNPPEYLFWVGSSGAYDRRYMKVTRSFVKILHHLGISYGVLGTEESDSGDAARRAGNELAFQMQAMMNIELMNSYEVKKIITCDPHDFNTLKNEYKDYNGNYEVWHHTQFLNKLLREGKLKLGKNFLSSKKITFHDPCYLGRGNNEYDAPRSLINALSNDFIEMKRSKSFALCCGAGGAQMFKEAEKGDKEVFIERMEDINDTACDIVITACPYCMTMLSDGIKYTNQEETKQNFDIAELIAKELNL